MVATSPVSRRFAWPQWPAVAAAWRRFKAVLAEIGPKGLYARTLIIIIAPIVLLETVVAFIFMERHWNQVTRRLSETTAREISALVSVYKNYPYNDDYTHLTDIARKSLGLTSVQVMPPGDLPTTYQRPFFGLLDLALSDEIRQHVGHPAWIDTVGQSGLVEVRIKLDDAVLRFVAPRHQTYASNSHIFLVWMVGTSVFLLTVAILFLRNQIRPILKLADAAESFGKGRPFPPDFQPRGAREVRQAAVAFIEMRDRIRTHVDQRTTMLAGVSHDLRTVLTRFKLELALLGETPEIRAMQADVNEMTHMLEDYLAFAKGDGGEEAHTTSVRELLNEIVDDAEYLDVGIDVQMRRRGDILVPLKRQAFKRAVTNLVTNAARYGDNVVIRSSVQRGQLCIDVDDDGPGVPPEQREAVFKPFYRLDQSRNQDTGHSGLGLAIARDIVRAHGGDVRLGTAEIGGLSAQIRVPL
jgi:two-component system, OmpR family, osmolarity sensor histidine kinase EnvZ